MPAGHRWRTELPQDFVRRLRPLGGAAVRAVEGVKHLPVAHRNQNLIMSLFVSVVLADTDGAFMNIKTVLYSA